MDIIWDHLPLGAVSEMDPTGRRDVENHPERFWFLVFFNRPPLTAGSCFLGHGGVAARLCGSVLAVHTPMSPVNKHLCG